MINEQKIKIIKFKYVGVGSTEVTVTYNIPGVFENNTGLDWTHPLSSSSLFYVQYLFCYFRSLIPFAIEAFRLFRIWYSSSPRMKELEIIQH